MSASSRLVDPKRGTGLGIAGQATQVIAWAFAFVSASARPGFDLWLVAVVAGVVGLALTIIACFLARQRLGVLGPAAAWVLIGGVAGAGVAFAAIPGSGEWGKLGAFVIALCVLGAGVCAGHLVASIGMIRGGQRVMGIAGVVAQGLAIALAGSAFVMGGGLLMTACVAVALGQAFLMTGFIGLRSVRAAPRAIPDVTGVDG